MVCGHCLVTLSFIIDHSTTQRKLRPFWESGKRPEKIAAAECKSTLDLLPEDLSLSCFGEGKLTQRSKRQGYRFFVCLFFCFVFVFVFCAMPFSWFPFCHVEHRHLTTRSAIARKLARPFQALSAKHVGALYRGTRLAET